MVQRQPKATKVNQKLRNTGFIAGSTFVLSLPTNTPCSFDSGLKTSIQLNLHFFVPRNGSEAKLDRLSTEMMLFRATLLDPCFRFTWGHHTPDLVRYRLGQVSCPSFELSFDSLF